MKLIHCSDFHIDSSLESNFDKNIADARRGELLQSFSRMVDYADKNGVYGILISGDLSDKPATCRSGVNAIRQLIRDNPKIMFFYIPGNHDVGNSVFEDFYADNLVVFSSDNASFSINNINIYGNWDNKAPQFDYDEDKINIVMIHGQVGDGKSRWGINLHDFYNKNIDYIAMGHVHSYETCDLPPRGIACYSGCPEGRGFDECGPRGFVLLDIDEERHSINHTFVPYARRRIYELTCDCTGLQTTHDVYAAVSRLASENEVSKDDIIRLILKGSYDENSELDTGYLSSKLSDDYYYVKIKDKRTPHIDKRNYDADRTLKGEFVRMVYGDDTILPEDKEQIIRIGLDALLGKEI